MIKKITVYSLPDGTDPDEFWKYHTEVHAADIKKVAGLRLRKYVINRVTKVGAGQPNLWGLVETWWESEEAMNEVLGEIDSIRTPDGKTIWDDFWARVTDAFTAEVEEREVQNL